MPKVLQINVTANWGSTGRIVEQIGSYIQTCGWKSYIAYGRMMNSSDNNLIKVGSRINVYLHFIEALLFDHEGLSSRMVTRKFINVINRIKPDIVHLHNIHDHWLNYRILFNYLNKTDIKVVWTFHDFWAVTGHCAHFVHKGCDKFKTECFDCPYTRGRFFPFFKRSRRNFQLKRLYFSTNKNLTVVPVSEWVGDNVRQSFFCDKEIYVIPNGIDVSIFKPTITTSKLSVFDSQFIIIAVSSQWKSGSKGLEDYKAMAKMLKKDELIVLVGVSDNISQDFPENIIGIPRTNSQKELAALYTRADVVCSFSSAETFGLTIIEGFACGTPAVVYNNTAPPSLITDKTGYVVPNKDYRAAYDAIQKIRNKGKSYYSNYCIDLVKEKYNKDKCIQNYFKLYESLLEK